MSKASASALWLRLSAADKELVRSVARAKGLSMDTYAQRALMNRVTLDAIEYADVIARQQETATNDEHGSTGERQ